MPIYSFRCPSCWKTESVFRKIEDRHDAPECGKCVLLSEPIAPVRMRRVIEAPAVQTDIGGYQSPIDGRWIEGRRARTEDLKRNNCRPWEGMSMERNEAIKRADEADKKFETSIEKGIADTFNNMSVEKQRVLNEAIG
jgi:putative FmdB family regulatory protein